MLLLVMTASPAAADSTGVCFTAVDDSLLDMSYLATWYGGQLCVPCAAFSYLGVYYTYFAEGNILQMYSGSNQLFFDLVNGGCTSGNDSTFTASAVNRNGTIYVPASFVSGFFGSYASHISGNGFGDIIRIKSGSATLTDAQFINAAESLMKARLGISGGSGSTSTPAPTTPSTPVPTPLDELKSGSASLCFVGMPTSAELDSLDSVSAALCFLITAQEALDSPDLLRRIAGAGHSIGIYCDSEGGKNAQDALDAVFYAAFMRPSFIAADDAMESYAREFAADNALLYLSPDLTYSSDANPESVKSAIPEGGLTVVLITDSGSAAYAPASYASSLSASGIRLAALRETFFD